MSREHYSEKQTLHRAWLFILSFEAVLCGSLFFALLKEGIRLTEVVIPISILLVANGFVVWVFLASRLVVSVDNVGVHYRYPVFYPKQKTILKNRIKGYSIRKYDAIFEFGGWGIKKRKNITCITIQGDTAVELVLKNDERIIIGTQNEDGISRAMMRLIKTDD